MQEVQYLSNKTMRNLILVWMMSIFQSNVTKDGFDICLIYQPPNSPNINVLDLGFVNVIQGLQ
ncbi:hypothetical protein Patl1_05088 [Pistacia atlantica]|uniref:Uncharacterized protein n=1 Tax=Pistacia atlantica TaxID=434234 RepID=A0ACC1BSG5_9ROSI|nr:hypothetical protein Patl1_05088 [Pistacia atlantica]